ncbi:MAG: hypothetical protein ACYDCC_06165 [Actinomycetota bacterium]
MSDDQTELAEFITALSSGLADARDLDEAIGRTAFVLSSQFWLWSASLLTITEGHLTVLARWHAAESILEAGAQISATLTPALEDVIRSLREGNCVRARYGRNEFGLLDDIMKEEGVASFLMLPLRYRGTLIGALSFGSSGASTFEAVSPSFLGALLQAVEAPLVRLMRMAIYRS